MSSAARDEDAPAAAAEQLLEGLHLPHEDEGSYQDACLNFFLLVDADTPPQRFQQLLAAAWAHDDLTALKLICNLCGRCVRDARKERFCAAALWMHRNHPRTLAGNLSAFADFGFIEDFPELLYRLVVSTAAEDEAPPSARTDDDPAPASPAVRARTRTDHDTAAVPAATRVRTDHAPAPASPTPAARKRARTDDDDSSPASPAVRIRTDHNTAAAPVSAATRARTEHAPAPDSPTAAARKRARTDGDDNAAAAHSSRTAATRKRARTDGDDDTATAPAPSSPTAMKTAELSGSVVDRVKVDDNVGPLKKAALKYVDLAAKMYKNDAGYKFLFDSVAGFFSERLRSDQKHLKDGNTSMIRLTAKWCPRPDSEFDQTTLLSDAIARSFFSGDSTPPIVVTDTIQDEKMGHRLVRDVLEPLDLQMQKLPQPNKKAKMKFPHNIIKCLGRESKSNADTKSRAVRQWQNMVAQFRANRCLIDCTAVCDLSPDGLFKSDPKLGMVAVALALLMSELSCNPWKDKVYPFKADRSVHLHHSELFNKTLIEKIELIRKIECHSIFSLRQVFEAILRLAKRTTPRVKAEDMVKTVFVFSYKHFDQAIEPLGPIRRDQEFDPVMQRLWRDDYDIISDKFRKAGYGEYIPQVVFWNLCGQRSAALTSIKDGVMYLSGYSDEMLKLFLKKNGVVYPEDEMSAAIAGEEYQKLEVLS